MRKVFKILLCFLAPGLVFAQAPSHFRLIPLKVSGEIQEIISEDLDQDGIKELVVIHYIDSNDSPQRYLSVFWSGPDCNYQLTNVFSLEVPSRFSLLDFGSLAGEREEVILMLSRNAVEYYRWRNHHLEGPSRLLSFSHQLVQLADPNRLAYYNFFDDWNWDKQNELLLFQGGGGKMFYLRQGKWNDSLLELPLEISYNSSSGLRDLYPHLEMTITYKTPNFYLLDQDGDSKPELFAISGRRIWIYKLNAEGIYDSEPAYKISVKMIPPDPVTKAKPVYNLQVAELDGDQRADLIATAQQGTFFNQKSELKIYYGKNNWADPENKNPKPTRIYNYNAWVIGPFIIDTNGDGNKDLIVPTMETGFMQTVKVLVANDFPVDWRYYLFSNQTLPEQPNFIDRINLHIDFNKSRMVGGISHIFADFNGDKIGDLIYGKNDQELVVVIKDKQGRRSSVQEIIQVPVGIFPFANDLNNDQKDDIIIFYSPQDPVPPGEFKVLVNLGKW